jgi:hypothetical protein
MSCCETLKVDIRARYKNDDILEQPYLNPLKKYTVCSIRWMGMQLLIRSMQLIVRSISLPFLFYAYKNFDSIMPAASYIKMTCSV